MIGVRARHAERGTAVARPIVSNIIEGRGRHFRGFVPALPRKPPPPVSAVTSIVKKLEAIIKPFKLDEVKEALRELGLDGMTVSEVKGYQPRGCGRGGAGDLSDLLPKFKIEVVVPDNLVERAVDNVLAAASTGLSGDGRVFISTIEQVIRIRTEETGLAAI